MRDILFVGIPDPGLPTGEAAPWRGHFAAHPMHARRLVREHAPDMMICGLPPDRALPWLAEMKMLAPATPRVGILPADTRFRVDVARLCHAMTSAPLSPARWDSFIDHVLGGEGIPALPTRLATANLPVLPRSAHRMLEALDAPQTDLSSAAALIERDPALAARVLGLANSSYYGLNRRVAKIADAASLLGTATLRTTVLACQVFGCFPSETATRMESVRSLSVLRMRLARHIRGTVDEEAATAALLADVGHLALLSLGHAPPEDVVPTPEALAGEFDAFGTDTSLLGAAILKKWGMPPGVYEAVAHWPLANVHPAKGLDTAAVVRIASLLASETMGEFSQIDSGWIDALGVGPQLHRWRNFAADLAMQWPAA